jgi:hypothetical protein
MFPNGDCSVTNPFPNRVCAHLGIEVKITIWECFPYGDHCFHMVITVQKWAGRLKYSHMGSPRFRIEFVSIWGSTYTHLDESIIDDTTNAVTIMLNYEPTLSLHPQPRAIPAVVVRAHYALHGGLVIVVVIHQRCHRPPPPPSLPTRGWLLLGAACRHHHPHHCRPPPTQPHQRRCLCRLASSSSPPCDPPPPVAVAPSPPSRSPMALSWTGMQHRCPPSRSDAASAAPARTPLIGIWAHCASAAVTTAAMLRFPLWRPEVDPRLLLGPPPPVGRRRRQHGDVDAPPWEPGATTARL